jgi:hypothetical protein
VQVAGQQRRGSTRVTIDARADAITKTKAREHVACPKNHRMLRKDEGLL